MNVVEHELKDRIPRIRPINAFIRWCIRVIPFEKIKRLRMKRNIVNTLLFLLLFFSIAGCKKYITKNVVGQYPESEFYTTQAQALLAINASYQPLAFTTSNGNRLWVFGDVASDDAATGGNPGDQADIEFIDQFNINSTNGNLASIWALLYDGITRCNLVLAKVPPIQMDPELQSRILGEAKFLRAYYYFELTNIFGDVPIVLTPLAPDQLQISQSTVQQIFETLIEPDLTDATNNLPAGYSGADVGRVTPGRRRLYWQKLIYLRVNGTRLPLLPQKL